MSLHYTGTCHIFRGILKESHQSEITQFEQILKCLRETKQACYDKKMTIVPVPFRIDSETGYRERYSSFSFFPPFFLPGFDRRDSICLLCNKHIYQTECIQETEVFLILTTQYAAQGNGMETAGAKQQPQRVV